MGYYVPQTLQNFNNWVLWRLEDGKKKPFSAKYNGLASVCKPYQWASYGAALQKLEYTDDYNGLGFVFSENCGLVFIDLDNCIDEDSGELSSFASNIIGAFSGTYIEYSQSGRGLHIVCRGKIPAAYKSEKIELYSSARYMAFTGNAYEAAEPADKQAELNKLCNYFQITKKEQPAQLTEAQPITAADNEILRMAEQGANGAQFRALWAGEWRGAYKTQSNADMRLIALLWYYSGNAEQVARLFLASGLADRKKAQRADYIQRTIEAAARNTQPAAAARRSVYNRGTNYTARAEAEQKQQNRGRSYWKK